jgi:hypothetical protein
MASESMARLQETLMSKPFEGHEFDALRLNFEHQVQNLRYMTRLDLAAELSSLGVRRDEGSEERYSHPKCA